MTFRKKQETRTRIRKQKLKKYAKHKEIDSHHCILLQICTMLIITTTAKDYARNVHNNINYWYSMKRRATNMCTELNAKQHF